MEKKFEKKTMFPGHPWEVVSMFESHIADCHAEIDRLNAELAALRSQPADERVWISSETHETFGVSGVWLRFSSISGLFHTYLKSDKDTVYPNVQYALILAEKDFPVPPKPESLEVKVGRYEFTDNGHDVVLDVLAIRTFSNGLIKVIYCYPDDLRSMKDVFDDNIEDLRKRLTDHNAVFIGGGDDEQ